MLSCISFTFSPSSPLPTLFSLLLLLFFPHFHATNNDMPHSEAETLFKIMDSMSSNQNWRISYPNPCDPASIWPGIECKLGSDSHLHVSRLDFGTNPNPTCKSTATFPNLIFSLPYLQSVFFLNCFTHTKTLLAISPNSSNSALQQLSLRSNPALFGPIPSQISSLKSLKILTLSQNHLSGPIPVEICSLNSLVHLDLSYNILTGTIPVQLGTLKNLVGLDLSYNSLTGTIPDTIGELGMLQKLDFSSNSLMGVIPDSIENLSSLAFMALSNNKFRGYFPVGLQKLQSLQYFIMDDNPMNIPLPVEFSKLVKLQELRLANSGYSGNLPPSFSLLMNLTTLSLQNNKLNGKIPESFGSLSHIYHMNLSRNLLSGVVPFDARFLKRLGRNLDLSSNSGLCLNPTEEFNVKIGIGVGICGETSKNSSMIKKSEGYSHGFSVLFSIFGGFLVHGLHQIMYLA
ncbi:receptor like protein 29 [Mercurialis annua]|uniref:receptor like protein 29 n=1 Tax=Mercurialis annua TaxID=3986 RepID=UPI00215E0DC6|nr:receptor like protein 29 [Mercurialis annua]